MKTLHMKKLVLSLLGLFVTMAGQSQSVPPLVYELEHTGASSASLCLVVNKLHQAKPDFNFWIFAATLPHMAGNTFK